MRLLFLTLAFFFSSGALYANDKDLEVIGIWWNTEKDARVEIYRCGKKLCGRVVWLQTPLDDNGQKVKDVNNSDKSLRNREIMGMNVLEGFSFNGKDRWTDGTAYDPVSGNSYTSYLRLKDRNTLELRGYIGTPMLGKTVLWERVK